MSFNGVGGECRPIARHFGEHEGNRLDPACAKKYGREKEICLFFSFLTLVLSNIENVSKL